MNNLQIRIVIKENCIFLVFSLLSPLWAPIGFLKRSNGLKKGQGAVLKRTHHSGFLIGWQRGFEFRVFRKGACLNKL